MLVLFPFEVDFYAKAGMDVVHVGHPLVDEVPERTSVWALEKPGEPAGPYRISLLPGSRRSEVEALLPTMLQAVALLARELPIEVQLIRAPTISEEMLAEEIALSGLPVHIVAGTPADPHGAIGAIGANARFDAIADSHLALCASGTATLEVGLLGTPMIVVYRLGGWTYLLARALVRLPDIALVNLVLGRRAVPELIQGEATPQRIAAEAARLLGDRVGLAGIRESLAEVRGRLGQGGASARAAREVASFLRLGVAA
jgi:lipid-A-disaccharide synthase